VPGESVASPIVRRLHRGERAPVVAEPRLRLRPRRVIDLRGVTKTFDTGAIQVRALRGISLEIERGDFVAIMGSSGSGNTTLINILG